MTSQAMQPHPAMTVALTREAHAGQQRRDGGNPRKPRPESRRHYVDPNRRIRRKAHRPSHAAARPTATPIAVSASRRMGCCQATSELSAATTSTTVLVMAAVMSSSGRSISTVTRTLRATTIARPRGEMAVRPGRPGTTPGSPALQSFGTAPLPRFGYRSSGRRTRSR